MFEFLKAPDFRQYIDQGTVSCPNRNGDVEVDLCAGCRWMQEIDRDAKQPFVRCDPPPWPLDYLRSPGSL